MIAVGQAAATLHHGLTDGHASVIGGFFLVFFAIWWAWMNFTWFASAYDTDDVLYRVAVFVIMAGVLIIAAGTPRALDGLSYGVITLGYVVMRTAMVALWLRVAFSFPAGRSTALRYALGIAGLQVLWVARLALPQSTAVASFLVLGVAEMAVPIWAERAGATSWHPGHIAERYGLFTIIVLGESLLAATLGVQAAWDADVAVGTLAPVVLGGLLTVFAMWWLYFAVPGEEVTAAARRDYVVRGRGIFAWGYGHYLVFASAAAVGAGLDVAFGNLSSGHGSADHSALSSTGVGLAVAVPVVVYLLAVWMLHTRRFPGLAAMNVAVPIVAALVLASAFAPQSVLIIGALLAVLIAVSVVSQLGDDAD